MKIVLFGTGCDLCREIAVNIEQAILESKRPIDFEKSSDLHQMLSFGVLSTPSVVIDGTIVSVSKPFSKEEALHFILSLGNSECRV